MSASRLEPQDLPDARVGSSKNVPAPWVPYDGMHNARISYIEDQIRTHERAEVVTSTSSIARVLVLGQSSKEKLSPLPLFFFSLAISFFFFLPASSAFAPTFPFS